MAGPPTPDFAAVARAEGAPATCVTSASSAASRVMLDSDAVRVTIATGFYALVGALMRDAEPEDDSPLIAGLETPSAARRSARLDAEIRRVVSDISAHKC